MTTGKSLRAGTARGVELAATFGLALAGTFGLVLAAMFGLALASRACRGKLAVCRGNQPSGCLGMWPLGGASVGYVLDPSVEVSVPANERPSVATR